MSVAAGNPAPVCGKRIAGNRNLKWPCTGRIIMKKVVLFLTMGLLLLSVTGSWADIAGSPHDFSTQGWSGGKICAPCHTPHNADTGVSNAPLWNHAVTSASFTPYTSSTMDSDFSNAGDQPGGISKLCLSCHDGTVAIDSFGNTTGGTFIAGSANVGTDLSDDHPISIYWNAPSGGPSHVTVSNCSTVCHQVHNPGYVRPIPFFGSTVNKTIECATCHDVHGKQPYAYLLRLDNANSALCLVCHTDKQ